MVGQATDIINGLDGRAGRDKAVHRDIYNDLMPLTQASRGWDLMATVACLAREQDGWNRLGYDELGGGRA